MSVPGPGATKAEWREWARARRSAVRAASEATVEALRRLLSPSTAVLLYDPLPDEVDITALADHCRALITRTDGDELTVHPYEAPREKHPLGFSQPVAGAPSVDPAEVDVALVPGLAFDSSGVRLGRGGGHYDRLLDRLRPDALRIGVTAAALVVDSLPAQPHDVRMTHLATEEGVRSVGGAAGLEAAARRWMAGDPDPETRAELRGIIESGDKAELQERMGSALEFGTAGIRGAVGAGSNRMNRAVVIRTSRGLADFLSDRGGHGPVVVGFDGRISSRTFADDAVSVLAAAGLEVRHFTEVAPTPLVAFSLFEQEAQAGVVITASHNPPRDNGYKVYDANGAQIIPPVDSAISAAIDAVGPAIDVPGVEAAPRRERSNITPLDDSAVADRYVEAVLSFRGDQPGESGSPRIAYTPLHGVGGGLTVRLLTEGGHPDVRPVPDQFEPDGRFPTVDFPNPEEPGTLDLVEGLASREGADLVLANDPDADRLGVSLPSAGTWRRLTGNEIGILLADFVLERTSGSDRLVVNSIVSSPMLAAVAEAHDARFARTLTGFKWVANAALDLEAEGTRFVFGYEEALGYTVGPVVRDKDGMSAALWFADLFAVTRESGETIEDRLAGLYERFGVWASAQHSIVRPGAEGAAEIATAIDALSEEAPDTLGGIGVVEVTDYRKGATDRPRWLPSTLLVELALEGGSRVLARPSGTEPKLKIYADVRGAPGSSAERARRTARRAASDLADFLGLGP